MKMEEPSIRTARQRPRKSRQAILAAAIVLATAASVAPAVSATFEESVNVDIQTLSGSITEASRNVRVKLIDRSMIVAAPSGTAARTDMGAARTRELPLITTDNDETLSPTSEAAPNAAADSDLSAADLAYLAELRRYRDSIALSLVYYDQFLADADANDPRLGGHLFSLLLTWSMFYDGVEQLKPTPPFADLHARLIAAFAPFDALVYQIEPAFDRVLAGETPDQQFAGYDPDRMAAAVAAARVPMEKVLAEIDQVLIDAGIDTRGAVAQ